MNTDTFFSFNPVERMPDLMIDLETMGTRPNAPIIAIGAAAFSLQTLSLGQQFYRVVDLQSSVDLGSVIDADTVMWWMEQSDEARGAFKRKGVTAPTALLDLREFMAEACVGYNDVKVWACGTDFDCSILSEHYHRAGVELPWRFWNVRDYRTVKSLFRNIEQAPRVGHHNALDDALHQVNHLFAIRRSLQGGSL